MAFCQPLSRGDILAPLRGPRAILGLSPWVRLTFQSGHSWAMWEVKVQTPDPCKAIVRIL